MERLEELEEDQKQEIVNAIKDNQLYDFICSNYYRIEDDVLLDLLKECIATLEEHQNKDLIDNLVEYKDWNVEI